MTRTKAEQVEKLVEARRDFLLAYDDEEAALENELLRLTAARADGHAPQNGASEKAEKIERSLASLPPRRRAAEKALAEAEGVLADERAAEQREAARALREELEGVGKLALILALGQSEHRRRDRDLGLVLQRLEVYQSEAVRKLRNLGDMDGQPVWPLGLNAESPFLPIGVGARQPSPEAVAYRIRTMLRRDGLPAWARGLLDVQYPDVLEDLNNALPFAPASVQQAVRDTKAALAVGLRQEGIVPPKGDK